MLTIAARCVVLSPTGSGTFSGQEVSVNVTARITATLPSTKPILDRFDAAFNARPA